MSDPHYETALKICAGRFRDSMDEARARLAITEALRAAADGARREAVDEATEKGKKYVYSLALTQNLQWVPISNLPLTEAYVKADQTAAHFANALYLEMLGKPAPWPLPTPPQPDPVAAAREAVVKAAMETHRAPPIIGDYQASVQRLFKACAALAALEKGEG
jgi:hypothetical protein